MLIEVRSSQYSAKLQGSFFCNPCHCHAMCSVVQFKRIAWFFDDFARSRVNE